MAAEFSDRLDAFIKELFLPSHWPMWVSLNPHDDSDTETATYAKAEQGDK